MSDSISPIAIVGCGAVVEQYYLPALRHSAGVACEMLIDPELPRIERLAAHHNIPGTAASLDGLSPSVQGVVVAVPNDLHVPVVTDALRRGRHVLCEKPLGRTSGEVRAMAEAADATGRGLFGAMVCRRYPAVRESVTNRLPALVGPLQEIDASYGFSLDWPVKSTSYYDRARSGGGSLLDFGAHLVDALFYVLGDPPFDVISCADDAEAGVDAEAEAHVELHLNGGAVHCTLRTSRLRRLPNSIVLRGAHGALEIPLSPVQPAMLRLETGSWPVSHRIGEILPCFAEQLEDFGHVMRDEPCGLPNAASLEAGIGLIEHLYLRRQPLTFCWDA